jgi:hypothetical protein
MSFSFTKTVTKTESWEHSSGFSFGRTEGADISIGAEVSVGIEYPGVDVSATYSVSTTYSVEETKESHEDDSYGGETSTEESWTATNNVYVPAGKAYECIATVK